MCVLISSSKSVRKFLILRTEQDMIKRITLAFMLSTHYSCPILIKLDFSTQFLENSSNFIFHKNPFSWSRVVTCGQTDGRTDMIKLIVVFRNFANAHKSTQYIFVGTSCQNKNFFIFPVTVKNSIKEGPLVFLLYIFVITKNIMKSPVFTIACDCNVTKLMTWKFCKETSQKVPSNHLATVDLAYTKYRRRVQKYRM
jgi:hypothetical protein